MAEISNGVASLVGCSMPLNAGPAMQAIFGQLRTASRRVRTGPADIAAVLRTSISDRIAIDAARHVRRLQPAVPAPWGRVAARVVRADRPPVRQLLLRSRLAGTVARLLGAASPVRPALSCRRSGSGLKRNRPRQTPIPFAPWVVCRLPFWLRLEPLLRSYRRLRPRRRRRLPRPRRLRSVPRLWSSMCW